MPAIGSATTAALHQRHPAPAEDDADADALNDAIGAFGLTLFISRMALIALRMKASASATSTAAEEAVQPRHLALRVLEREDKARSG